jgi:hypothetical protein
MNGDSNPYEDGGQFWFRDLNGFSHGPYPDGHKAMVALFEFMQMQREWREYGDARKRDKAQD